MSLPNLTSEKAYQTKSLYEWLINNELISEPSIGKKFLICGGKRLGKTRLMERLHTLLNQEAAKPKSQAILLFGSDYSDMRRKLEEYSKNIKTVIDSSTALLIDDIDEFLSWPARHGLAEKDTHTDSLTKLNLLMDSFLEADKPVYVSTTKEFKTLVNEAGNLSREERVLSINTVSSSRHYEIHTLNPWSGAWENRLKFFVSNLFVHSGRGKSPVIDEWHQAIMEVTGGHPFIFQNALKILDGLLSDTDFKNIDSEETLTTRGVLPAERKLLEIATTKELKDYLTDRLMRRAVPVIQDIFRQVKEKNHQAYQSMLHFINAKDFEIQPVLRQILEYHGLVRFDIVTRQTIPAGSLIEQLIREEKDRDAIDNALEEPETLLTSAAVSNRLEPDAKEPEKRGRLIVIVDGQPREVALKGEMWRLLKFLEEQNTFCSVKSIAKHLFEHPASSTEFNPSAVRSTIQRLKSKISTDLGDSSWPGKIIDNSPHKGYRFIKDRQI